MYCLKEIGYKNLGKLTNDYFLSKKSFILFVCFEKAFTFASVNKTR